jgi:hypothetical protein
MHSLYIRNARVLQFFGSASCVLTTVQAVTFSNIHNAFDVINTIINNLPLLQCNVIPPNYILPTK